MELQELIKRTLHAANHAEWMGMQRTSDLLKSLANDLMSEKNSHPALSFPQSGDNFTNIVDLSAREKFTFH